MSIVRTIARSIDRTDHRLALLSERGLLFNSENASIRAALAGNGSAGLRKRAAKAADHYDRKATLDNKPLLTKQQVRQLELHIAKLEAARRAEVSK
jgi:hypothetical protein